jgi:hypothetical protein
MQAPDPSEEQSYPPSIGGGVGGGIGSNPLVPGQVIGVPFESKQVPIGVVTGQASCPAPPQFVVAQA